MSDERTVEIRRLGEADRDLARSLFAMMENVFGESAVPLSDSYVEALLVRESFWAIAATVDGEVAGGLTGHTLPLTSREESELFVYDIAVAPAYQRQGIGRGLVEELTRLSAPLGLGEVFVAADNDDAHAFDFYRALGGEPAPVTIFTFARGRA